MDLKELILNKFNSEEVILNVFNMECKYFMKTESYRLIEQKCKTKCLNPNEIQQLKEDVQYVFTLLAVWEMSANNRSISENIALKRKWKKPSVLFYLSLFFLTPCH